MQPMPPTNEQKRAEIKRELDKRRQVYPELINSKKLSRELANWRYFVLKCIFEDYAGQSDKISDRHVAKIRWSCPLCNVDQFANPGQRLVDCATDDVGCGAGPFYLAQFPAGRAFNAAAIYKPLRIEGLNYHRQTKLELGEAPSHQNNEVANHG